jgi:hypothetical protein
MNGREREGRDFANRLARPGWAVGRGKGGGHGRWTRTRKPKIWIASAQGQGRAGQGRAGQAGQTGRTGPGRAEQTATCSQQPATLKQLTAEGGDHRATHLAHRSTCCSRTASRERASAAELEKIEGLRVFVSPCLRLHVFPPFFTFAHSEYCPRWGPAPVMRHPQLVIPSPCWNSNLRRV